MKGIKVELISLYLIIWWIEFLYWRQEKKNQCLNWIRNINFFFAFPHTCLTLERLSFLSVEKNHFSQRLDTFLYQNISKISLLKNLLYLKLGRESALSLPAEWQWNCTLLYYDERQRNLPEGASPLDPPGEGQNYHRGLRPLDPLPPFQQRQVCYDKDVILPRMCTYAAQLDFLFSADKFSLSLSYFT